MGGALKVLGVCSRWGEGGGSLADLQGRGVRIFRVLEKIGYFDVGAADRAPFDLPNCQVLKNVWIKKKSTLSALTVCPRSNDPYNIVIYRIK